jgi:O-acetyl-ADP-ribose deacetylase (regulator of RNase III)
MKIIFCDRNPQIVTALRDAFMGIPYFEFIQNDINSLQADCIVSPGNSYGLMDGGVDRIINYCLDYISEKVQKMIQYRYAGEQPVGTCMIVPVNSGPQTTGKFKYLAHTPTMRTPKDISTTCNAYIAFRALLTELIYHNRQYNDINTVVVTMFCSGAGKMNPVQSAQQMRMAYNCVMGNTPCEWNIANKIEESLLQINGGKLCN